MLGFVYSLASYLGFLAVFVYFACFTAGAVVPQTVDTGSPGSVGAALAIDLALIVAFGLQHSVMARKGFKRWLTRLVPESLERSTYVLFTSLVLALLIGLWRPLPFVLFHVAQPELAATLWILGALGWLGVPFTSFLIDHFDLFGVKRAFNGFRRRSLAQKGFVTPLLYKYVRHPMMTSVLVGLWATPHFTLGHLVLAAGMSGYIVVGVHFEERSLIAELGSAYVRYQATTPKFLPFGAPEARDQTPTSAPLSGNG
jgi:protein-S-isoprenylcysteine O-methyltransferase Ste14